jgi:uncharacterized protein YeaO (DUF488 family)
MTGKAVRYEVRIKRVYEPAAAADGKRILVDRLWPRGISKAAAGIDLWLKEVGPSTELRKWFGHEPARWEEFRSRYNAELADNPAFTELGEQLTAGPITLLYGARDEAHNQAVVLADRLRKARS